MINGSSSTTLKALTPSGACAGKKMYFFPGRDQKLLENIFSSFQKHSRGLLIPTTIMSKISIELHLVAELEHQTDFLFFRSGSETAILGIEKYRFAVNAKNGLLNYQKCFLIFKKIICCDFRIFFSEKNIFFGSEMWISLKTVFLIPKWSWEPQK